MDFDTLLIAPVYYFRFAGAKLANRRGYRSCIWPEEHGAMGFGLYTTVCVQKIVY